LINNLKIQFQYPSWLEENKATLTEEKIANIIKQQELMKNVCDELDKELSSDTDDVKSKRFDKVLDLMQQVIAYLFVVLMKY
jgi:CRISPR/Cas system CSM-associated protein Csm2 small subunit